MCTCSTIATARGQDTSRGWIAGKGFSNYLIRVSEIFILQIPLTHHRIMDPTKKVSPISQLSVTLAGPGGTFVFSFRNRFDAHGTTNGYSRTELGIKVQYKELAVPYCSAKMETLSAESDHMESRSSSEFSILLEGPDIGARLLFLSRATLE